MYADTTADLEQRIVDKLAARAETSSICPSDVARDVGDVGDADSVKGPIRIRRGREWDSR